MLRRPWQLKVSDKCYRMSHDFGPTVKITFARNGHDIEIHEFSFEMIDYTMLAVCVETAILNSMHLLMSISDPSDFGGLK